MLHSKVYEKSLKFSMSFFNFLKFNKLPVNKFYISSKFYSQTIIEKQETVEDLFLNPNVQRILKKITGMDYDKIFAVTKAPLEPHKYEFATDERLKELQEEATTKALKKLQMPPVISIRKPIEEVLSKDPELQGYLKHKIIFTDISPNVSSRDRLITVREIDGTLRKAFWDERDRMNQIFYPIEGRHLETPKLFETSYLERLLTEGSYKFVLDSACIQFEPDDSEYHRVTTATYDHIRSKKQFDVLRSTRYFGPMAFYYAYTNKVDLLIIDMIERQLLSDASDTIKLLYFMHKELTFSENIDGNDPLAVIEDYITNHAIQKEDLEYALRTYEEQHLNTTKDTA